MFWIWPHIEVRKLNSPDIYVHIASNSHDSLLGYGGLQMASVASKIEFGLRFEIINLNYHDTDVHIGSNGNSINLWGCGDLQMTSVVTSDLKFELTDLNYQCYHAFLASEYFLEMIKRKEGRRRPIIIHRLARRHGARS